MLSLIVCIGIIVTLLYVLYNFVPSRKRCLEMEEGIRLYLAEMASIEQAQKELNRRKQIAEQLLSTLVGEGGVQ